VSFLERKLSRAISPEERGSVDNLNDVTAEQIEEAGALLQTSRLDAAHYLQTIVRRSELDHVADFLEEVVAGGAEARTWRRRDLICVVDVSLPSITELTEERLLDILGAVEGTRWLRIAPTPDRWDDFSFCGAPGVLVQAAPYWWDGPELTNVTDVARDELDAIADPSIALRRWLASRIAWELRRHPDPASVDEVIHKLRAAPPSPDARIAIEALLREKALDDTSRPPGFRGPDSWFAD
jgi:hypothetical protein